MKFSNCSSFITLSCFFITLIISGQAAYTIKEPAITSLGNLPTIYSITQSQIYPEKGEKAQEKDYFVNKLMALRPQISQESNPDKNQKQSQSAQNKLSKDQIKVELPIQLQKVHFQQKKQDEIEIQFKADKVYTIRNIDQRQILDNGVKVKSQKETQLNIQNIPQKEPIKTDPVPVREIQINNAKNNEQNTVKDDKKQQQVEVNEEKQHINLNLTQDNQQKSISVNMIFNFLFILGALLIIYASDSKPSNDYRYPRLEEDETKYLEEY